jgi:hypothetical protein
VAAQVEEAAEQPEVHVDDPAVLEVVEQVLADASVPTST